MDFILASQSHARKTMLENAGYVFDCSPANIGEKSIISALLAQKMTPTLIAQKLAEEKAKAISVKNPDSLIIGSDQVLEIEGKILNKAKSSEDAHVKLKTLRGKTHTLISAVSVAKNNQILWSDTSSAHLTMHNFSDDFLARYCEKAADALTRSVGAYELESHGIHLFDSIEGDYYTILGMPLLKLTTYLREEQEIGL
ncbi:MAG: Maf family nucleotide pyrophosphatase [Micavibrio sp.]|nr:Maf family nucleotide pyrophosphatase [Micavibrio sp.]